MTKFRVARLPRPDKPGHVEHDVVQADIGELSQAGAAIFFNETGPGLFRTLVCMYAPGQWLHIENIT